MEVGKLGQPGAGYLEPHEGYGLTDEGYDFA